MTSEVKRKKRPSLVCENCKRKKIKCDKGSPCNMCIKAGLTDSCSYEVHSKENQQLVRDNLKRNQLPYVKSAKNPIGFNIKQSQFSQFPSSKASNRPTSPATKSDSESVSVSRSELDFLKKRLMQIESSLGSQIDSPQYPGAPVPPVRAPVPVPVPAPVPAAALGQGQGPGPYQQTPLHYQPTPSPIPVGYGATYQQQHGPMSYLPQNQLPVSSALHSNDSGRLPSFDNSRSNGSHRGSGTLSWSSVTPAASTYETPSSTSTANTTSSQSIQLPPLRIREAITTGISMNPPFKEKTADEQCFILDQLCQVEDIDQLLGVNPYRNSQERINLFEGYTSIHVKEPSRRINYGPFAWSSLMKRDYGLRLLWDYMIEQKASSKERNDPFIFGTETEEITQENADVLTNDGKEEGETAFQKRALEPDGYGDIMPYEKLLNRKKQRTAGTPSTPSKYYDKVNSFLDKTFITGLDPSKQAGALGVTITDGNLSRELQLIQRIQKILPKKKVIYKLVDVYFTKLYPFLPFVDEECMRENIKLVLGTESYEDVNIERVKIERRLDLAYIGILLIILRLSYLSLFSNKSSKNKEKLLSEDPSPEAQDLKYLFSNPINIEMIDIAQSCLDLFQIYRKTNLTVLLLALFLRVYRTFAPEDGDGADGGDLQVFGAMLIQMAYSLGLHREPDKFNDVCNNPKLNHLGRKVFQYLILLDIHQSYNHGTPISVDPSSHDVKMPFYDPESCNIKNKELDKIVTENYAKCLAIFPLMTTLKKLLNAKDGCNISEVCNELGQFEVSILNFVGSPKKCFDSPVDSNSPIDTYNKNFSIKFLISIFGFYMSVYFHFYLYFEHKCNNLSFFYMKKMLLMSKEIMLRYFDLLGKKDYICDLFINPVLEQFIHKANQLILALIIRVNYSLFHLVRKEDHQKKLDDINDPSYRLFYEEILKVSRLLKRAAEISISAISKISNRYYYAWRITKSHTYLLKTITKVKFYEDNVNKSEKLTEIIYSYDQVKLINKILESSVANFDFVEPLAPEFCPMLSSPAPPLFQTKPIPYDSDMLDFGANFINNEEIDLLWFQIISLKYDLNQDQSLQPLNSVMLNGLNEPDETNDSTYTNKGNKTNTAPVSGGVAAGGAVPDIRHGFDLEEMARFDIFNDLPFDQLFSKNAR